MTFGKYPSVITLKQARLLHEAAKKLSLVGVNPKERKATG